MLEPGVFPWYLLKFYFTVVHSREHWPSPGSSNVFCSGTKRCFLSCDVALWKERFKCTSFLKGQCHEIFDPRFFFIKQYPLVP
jgi:hypothetical protein